MNITEYNGLISQNIAPYEATAIGLYDKQNNKVGEFSLQGLKLPSLGKKLYSFGAISYVHITYNTAQEDFKKALIFLNETEDVDFTCVCGDLTGSGTAPELETYISYINNYSSDTPVFEVTGNHECYDMILPFEGISQYTGHNLYYSFTQGNDVFIMFGMQNYNTGVSAKEQEPFSQEALQWLYETLEENRNKRCIVFQHCLRFDGSGSPYNSYMTVSLLSNTKGSVFKSLMEHYKNVVWFHGHSHMKFDCQEDADYANYDRKFGCHSIHIPSLAVPRDYANDTYVAKYAESEGYIVDMYENHIVLRGRDFVKEKFLPIATYCIDTTLQNIEAKTYIDSTGTITTV